jgi:catechol 2,3-dioxygenase-like lactoylglutathione lyase family enzyme
MALAALDHINIRTARLGVLTDFYAQVLGLKPGKRPPFKSGGAWLYCGDRAAVHLVEVSDSPEVPTPRIEHFAFRAENLAEFLAQLRESDIAYQTNIVPDLEIRQVNIYDPDGNHIEIAFGREEEADLSDFPAA